MPADGSAAWSHLSRPQRRRRNPCCALSGEDRVPEVLDRDALCCEKQALISGKPDLIDVRHPSRDPMPGDFRQNGAGSRAGPVQSIIQCEEALHDCRSSGIGECDRTLAMFGGTITERWQRRVARAAPSRRRHMEGRCHVPGRARAKPEVVEARRRISSCPMACRRPPCSDC